MAFRRNKGMRIDYTGYLGGLPFKIFTAHYKVAKRDELHTFKAMPQRWMVVRSFAWLEKNTKAAQELRTQAQHKPTVCAFSFLGSAVTKILNRLLASPISWV
jgi:hypothetical protein